MEIKKKIKRVNVWVRRKVHLPLFIIIALVVILLFFNEDTSLSLNRKYDAEINYLRKEIQKCKDSTRYYNDKYNALLTNKDDLEKVAREQYNMHRNDEDVFIIKNK